MDIDNEIRAIIDRCYDKAKHILLENRDKLDLMAEALMQYETIDAEQVDAIMSGRKPEPPKGWDDGDKPQEKTEVVAEEKPARVESSVSAMPPIGGPAAQH